MSTEPKAPDQTDSAELPQPTRPAVYVRLTPAEHFRLAKDAAVRGCSLPEALRVGYFRGAAVAPLLAAADARAILVALTRIGNNINQIARRLNGGWRGGFSGEFQAMKDEFLTLYKAVMASGEPEAVKPTR